LNWAIYAIYEITPWVLKLGRGTSQQDSREVSRGINVASDIDEKDAGVDQVTSPDLYPHFHKNLPERSVDIYSILQ
jgi:hypothetical protein